MKLIKEQWINTSAEILQVKNFGNIQFSFGYNMRVVLRSNAKAEMYRNNILNVKTETKCGKVG